MGKRWGAAGLVILAGELAFGQGPKKPPERFRFSLPENLSFAGQRVPTDHWFVKAGLQEWLLREQAEPSRLCKYMLRSRIYEPMIKERFQAANQPTDLFYIAVIESGLSSDALSRAGALGWWQFMRGTGRQYRLRHTGIVDERTLIGKATEAAIAYFEDLHNQFNDWFLAAVAYNAGSRRVQQAIRRHNTRNAWMLHFPARETNQYLYRAVVIKEIMEHPYEYGFPTEGCSGAYTPRIQVISQQLDSSQSLDYIANRFNIPLVEFFRLNPQYEDRQRLPPGEYQFVLPTNAATPLGLVSE